MKPHIFFSSFILAVTASFASADETARPVWDLATNEISPELTSGNIEQEDDGVVLENGAAFAVPASAFEDSQNFTVEVTASIRELKDDTLFTVMKKQSEDKDDGFTFGMNYREEPWYARQVFSIVNNVVMQSGGIGGKQGPKANKDYTFIVSMKEGFASFYIDGKPYTKCFMEVIPNHEPMWIGRNLDADKETMNVVIRDVKVYGSDFEYVSDKEADESNPRGKVAGQGWALDVPKIEHPDWPKVLIYGDSISMGYRRYFIPALLGENAYVFHCVHFINGGVPKQALTEMAASYDFDVVVFNNGLHSLHWTPDKVSDEEIYDRMQTLAECFQEGAPQAEIYYLLTTPHTAKRPGPNEPVEALGDKNDIVVRLNTISEQVMEEEGIEVIDVYTPLSENLEFSSGDGYHWQAPGYEIISDKIQERILPVLEAKP